MPEIVEKLEVDVDNDEIGCYGYDEQDCKYYFVYYYDDINNLKVRVQKQKECPTQIIANLVSWIKNLLN